VIGADLRAAPRWGKLIGITVEQGAAAVEAAARRLSIRLEPHEAVIGRVKARVALLTDHVDAALSTGELVDFNKEYRQGRLAARGTRSPSYNAALSRLRAALAAELERTEILRQVFG
jgi:hypothetical protein